MPRIRSPFRWESLSLRSLNPTPYLSVMRSAKAAALRALRTLGPSLLFLTIASAAQAQGTMDFSGAQTLMGTFKTFLAYLRRADEGTLSKAFVEAVILMVAARPNGNNILREAATLYKVDTDAIANKVKQEFAAREKAKKAPQPASKPTKKAA